MVFPAHSLTQKTQADSLEFLLMDYCNHLVGGPTKPRGLSEIAREEKLSAPQIFYSTRLKNIQDRIGYTIK